MKGKKEMSDKWKSTEALVTEEELRALKDLNAFYNGPAIADWLAGLWEPTVGGFYYANSARDCEGYLPDIESTVQLLRWLENNGAFDGYGSSYVAALPADIKDKIAAYAQSLESPDDGYFYHPQWGNGVGISRKGRDLGWATGLLRLLGKAPLYPTANDRIAASAAGNADKAAKLPEWLSSRDAYMKWLREGNSTMRENSGNAHAMNASCGQIVSAGYLTDTLDFLDEMQEIIYNEQIAAGEEPTGLWQKPVDYHAVWGLLKFAPFYGKGNRPIKHVLEIARTCVNVILLPAADGRYFMNDVYNQWSGLASLIGNASTHNPHLVPEIHKIVRARLPEMIYNSIEKLRPFKQADGTFSYRMGQSSPVMYGTPASLGLAEGDVNATCLASSMYRCVFADAGLDVVKLCDPTDGERFLSILREGRVYPKYPKEHFENKD